MLSAVISSERSYSTVPLAGQPIHQRFVRSGLLILGAAPLNLQRLQQIRTDDLLLSNHINYLNYVCGALSFLQGLHIAMQSGLYLIRLPADSGVQSLRILQKSSSIFRLRYLPPPFI